MRVLWFTNMVMPDACRQMGRPAPRANGWWMVALLDRLKQRRDMQLAVVVEAGLRDASFQADGVDYFVLKMPWQRAAARVLRLPSVCRPVRSQLARYGDVISRWNPDVIHVHGTERDYGLVKAWGYTAKPCLVSIQGLLIQCVRKAFGDLLPGEVLPVSRRLMGVQAGSMRQRREWRCGMAAEEAIFKSVETVVGRTAWDHAWAWAYNPGVRYRHVDEMMRPEFMEAESWRVEVCEKLRIFTTSGPMALKGLHVLLEAVARLRQVRPDVKLKVASSGFVPPVSDYARYVAGQVRRWGLESTVEFLGWLDGNGLVEQMRLANCFVTPSFIENGCNALQEAMLVGCPCVATMTGGLLTTIESEVTGLMYPVGDPAFLAWQINRLFKDDALACRLGQQARKVATERHSLEKIEAQILSAYRELCGQPAASERGE